MSSDRTKQICLWMTIYIYIYIYIYISMYSSKLVQSAWAAEYSDCISAEG